MTHSKKTRFYFALLFAAFSVALANIFWFQKNTATTSTTETVTIATTLQVSSLELLNSKLDISNGSTERESETEKVNAKNAQANIIPGNDNQETFLSAREKTTAKILSSLVGYFGKNLPDNIQEVIENIYNQELADLNLFESLDEAQLLAEVYEHVEIWDLEQIGYFDSMALDEYDRSTIESMAESGDVRAIQNMADHHYFDQYELAGDALKSSQSEAKALYKKALAMGSVRSASVMAEINVIEKKPIDAYAWYSISKELGDHKHAAWFENLTLTKTMDAAAITEAKQLTAKLKQELFSMSMELNANPDLFAGSVQ